MTAMPEPAYIAIGSVIIDDIVYPDGRTSMGVLGGGGTHAAYGMALAGEKPGIVAVVGADLPQECRRRMTRDFDASGLVWTAHPQARGWQIFEWDGRRNEIFRVDVLEPFMTGPEADSPDLRFDAPAALTLLRAPDRVEAWRKRYPAATLLWEPIRAFMMRGDRDGFLQGVPHADIVSPNLLEAQTTYGVEDEREILRRMLDDGCRVVALRMGELGSIVARQGDGQACRIPALSVAEVVDQTGAGNTYCGGFLVGWREHADLALAGCYGAVAASFALEHVGCAHIPPNREALWRGRMDEALAGVTQLAL